MNLNEQPLSADYKYRGRIINLRVDTALLPNGSSATREVVEHPGGVCVAALTEDGCLLFVRQFRYPYQKVLLELPAGKLDPGEDPLEAGKRELREETGAEAARYESLGELYPSPGYCGEIIHLYAATGLTFGQMSPDEDEFLEQVTVPFEEAVAMAADGRLEDSKSVAAILRAAYLCKED